MHTTSFPQRSWNLESRWTPSLSAAPTLKTRSQDGPSLGPWNRVVPGYYSLNGFPAKTTSASKSPLLDPRIAQELNEVREANAHFVNMRSGARCEIPRAQVVCVRDLYPEKELLPRCTLLHRCGDSAGCCEEEGMHCAPKAIQEVVLHFYVLGGDHRSNDVEKLLFENHTECECQAKPQVISVTTSTTTTTTTAAPITPNVTVSHEQPLLRDQQQNKCRPCPNPFCIREHERGRCSCDCFDRHKPCIRIKRGREALTDTERRCVDAGHCNIPDCEYGAYDPDRGRCPRRPDYDAPRGPEGPYKRPPANHKNPNHRWLYFERD
ncbi:uncharacterized protein LOC129223422 isoform X2 [Uloborus diversus]|uniref:uncharacterized protein LOC129223422 isoform X2 n=1 Tax=Uloborus diversus TaxID=327109 RepID=UPI00240A6E7C|nr:uncharacterized protein LOC129223422 isoform X2 [Uloborus diversus]